ncbi:pyridoxamine 5'-phosphate oxidase family protein [Georgenia daeguensis]|uniref:Pyridoxamine 5'-phosphate oxidase family protein n=1 Tax=Georgenia daeguensis TaxID=908355 RepID=A0ABP8ESR3_9MICO
MTDKDPRTKVTDLIKGIRTAMVTTTTSGGELHSRPLATQDVDFDGDVYFIVERDSSVVTDVAAHPRVNVAYAGDSSWVSLSGTARVLDDHAKLAELWNTFTDAWMQGGPEDPRNVLLHVSAESAEYWDSPGAKVVQLANLVKSKVTGRRVEGDSGTVEL